jgi:hypothetical protein
MQLVIVCLDGKAVTVGWRLAQKSTTVLETANVLRLTNAFAMTVSQEQTAAK